MFEKDRRRRVLFNDDGETRWEQPGYFPEVTDEKSFLQLRVAQTFDTQVDTYVWCIGNGCDPPWGPHRPPIWPALGSFEHANDMVVNACHDNEMEVWCSLRINDVHDGMNADCLEKADDPFKAQHPELLIGDIQGRQEPLEVTERWIWTALNFEHEQVHQHRLDYIEKTATEHDFDGYELDFTRFWWQFPLGRELELAPRMTDFIRKVRTKLNIIGEKRGRPYTFAVHVADSIKTAKLLGQDVEAWLSEDLVDVLVVGMGYVPFLTPIDEWQTLAGRHGIPVYPSVNANCFIPWHKERLKRVSAWFEAMRATAAWWWLNGADGVYIFNHCCGEARKRFRQGLLSNEQVFAHLNEVGDPATLVGKPKLYGIHGYGKVAPPGYGSIPTPLPIPLCNKERRIFLQVGPDAEVPAARFKLHAFTIGGSHETMDVWIRVNHKRFKPSRQDDHYILDVPNGLLHAGHNEVSFQCNVDLTKTQNPMILEEVLVEVSY